MQIKKVPTKVPALPTEKTASATDSRLARALEVALGETTSVEKTASEAQPKAPAPVGSVSAHLAKFAEDIASSQFDRQLAQVDRLGTAMADAFVRRIGAHEESAEKLAAMRGDELNLTHAELEMINDMRTRPDTFFAKVAAMHQQYADPIEKTAQEVYTETANETVRAIHKHASDCVADGYRAALELMGAT